MLKKLILSAAFCTAITLGAAPALAQSETSDAGPAKHFTAEQAASFSKQIEKDLAAKGARVALVFRAGRPREDLPDDTAFTHGAFFVYQPIDTADRGRIMGYAVYNLYHGDGEKLAKSKSHLVQDFPFDFVAGSQEDDVAVIVPTPDVQARLLKTMASPVYADLHVPEYASVANPGDARYQNCTEFMLDVLAASVWETSDYGQLKANLAVSFKGTKIKASPVKRFLAPVADERLRLDDHDGAIRTATYESLAQFMAENDYATETYRIEKATNPGA